MTVCTFAGHREVYGLFVDEKIEECIEEVLQGDREFLFYVGGMGEFDKKCATAVRKTQKKYPHLCINLVLVLPYLSNRLNTEKTYYTEKYDSILIPFADESVHYKAAIQKRNRWMVDRATCVIAYIRHKGGGAWETVRYAERCRKRILYVNPQNGNVSQNIQ